VIVDGDSNDGTKEYLGLIARSSVLDIIWKSEKDLGIYDAMNKGVITSESDFVIFINAGDEVSEFFGSEAFYGLLKNYQSDALVAGIAYSCVYQFNRWKITIDSRDTDISRMPSLHQGIVYKREKHQKFNY
tara:strand:- start:51 stop:443 length:393 start_codon:yes stop_codon:yes gene_type:complete